jgi:hypothetical protein
MGLPLNLDQRTQTKRGTGRYQRIRPYFNPRGPMHFICAGQSGAGSSHFLVNCAGNKDLSVEFAEHFQDDDRERE